MVTEYRNQIFHSLIDRGEAITISSVKCENCHFINSALALTTDIRRRSCVQDVTLTNCIFEACDLGPAVLKNVSIDGLITGDLFIVWAALFDRVEFKGNIGKIKINQFVHHVDRSVSTQKPFDDYRMDFYENVEWALDISKARFRLLDIEGIPSRLIRRDPSTQMVATRERLLNSNWRAKVSPENQHWTFVLESFLAGEGKDVLLVAPLSGPKKQRDSLLRGLEELRALGVVE